MYWSIPRLWPGETIAIIGGGPSLTPQQVNACKGKCRVIAINDSLQLAPWCDIHYFCDSKWWNWHHEKSWFTDYKGIRVTMENKDLCADGAIKGIRNAGIDGWCEDPTGLHTGQNSGYQCVNMALHLGATRILLLGIDMREIEIDGEMKKHWFGDHPDKTYPDIYRQMTQHFKKAAPALVERGIEVINCTPGSALHCFAFADVENIFQ